MTAERSYDGPAYDLAGATSAAVVGGDPYADTPTIADLLGATPARTQANGDGSEHQTSGDEPRADGSAAGAAEKVHAWVVDQEVLRARAREEARRRLRAEARPVRPPLVRLDEFLAVADEPVRYRIDEVFPVGARVLLAAQFKAGKSTATGNLVRCLADGDPFLGRFRVTSPAGPVVLVDNELDARTLRRWLRDQGVRHPERVALVSLRGRVSTFDLTDPAVILDWAEQLRGIGAAVVVLDCLRPVLDAIGLDEKSDAGRFLVAFDEMLARAGVGEAVVVHHMGHSGERSRGDSRLLDWPDASWTIVRQDEDPASARYFTAYGRDVAVGESRLEFDAGTRWLTIVDGNRRDADTAAAVPVVLAVVREAVSPPSGRMIEAALGEVGSAVTQRQGRAAVTAAIASGLLRVEKAGTARLHYLTDAGREHLDTLDRVSASERVTSASTRPRECVSASIGRATHTRPGDDPECVTDAPLCIRCRHAPAEVLDRCRACAYPTGTDDEEAKP